jgi:serine/threonine-protein kinase
VAVERFLREARSASAISNDHVVRIYDVGRLPTGMPYMVMEYLPGVTLGALAAQRGPLPIAEAIDYALQACVALAECHALGIVHRDLKPDNIMVLQRPGQLGFVKLLDFGISKSDWFSAEPEFTPNLTGTTDVFGTPTHMSPEQVRSSKSVDQRTDIWALGVILYEVLTSAPPFMADTLPALSAAIVTDEPIHPSARRADLPRELGDVVLACLAKKPEDRPQSVAQLAEVLRPWAGAASNTHVERIRGMAAADPLEASRPWPRMALGNRPLDTASAWGTTRQRRRSTSRGILFGVGAGFLVFVGILVFLALRARSTPSPTATIEAVSEPATLASPAGAPPAIPSETTPQMPDAAGISPAGSTPAASSSRPPQPVPHIVRKHADPLDDRY